MEELADGEAEAYLEALTLVEEALTEAYPNATDEQIIGLFNRAVMGHLLIQRVAQERELEKTWEEFFRVRKELELELAKKG